MSTSHSRRAGGKWRSILLAVDALWLAERPLTAYLLDIEATRWRAWRVICGAYQVSVSVGSVRRRPVPFPQRKRAHEGPRREVSRSGSTAAARMQRASSHRGTMLIRRPGENGLRRCCATRSLSQSATPAILWLGCDAAMTSRNAYPAWWRHSPVVDTSRVCHDRFLHCGRRISESSVCRYCNRSPPYRPASMPPVNRHSSVRLATSASRSLPRSTF